MELVFNWAKRETDLGIEYTPECTMAIQTKNKTWVERVFKIDTGSNVTFMEVDDCHKLGYTQRDCKPYDFTNANREVSRAYVKKFTVKIGDYPIKNVLIAFSAKPLETLILGRAGIFDSLNIYFHSRERRTVFFSPDET